MKKILYLKKVPQAIYSKYIPGRLHTRIGPALTWFKNRFGVWPGVVICRHKDLDKVQDIDMWSPKVVSPLDYM